jgi:Mg-chelatase subunit ChlD
LSPVEVRDVLNPEKTRTLSDHEVGIILRRCQVLGTGLSGRLGISIRPGNGWAADLKKKVLIYDLGTAAILDDTQRTGVIAHEAGHLRFTEDYVPANLPATARSHPGRFHLLANSIEDRRMELQMESEYAGLARNFEELARTFDLPELIEGVKKADPAQQFTMGCYRMLYGREPVVTYPEVKVALDSFKDELQECMDLRGTLDLVNQMIRPGGLWDTLYGFITDPPDPPEGEPGEDGEEGEGEGQKGKGKAKSKPGSDDMQSSDDADSGDGEGEGEDGDSGGESGDKSGEDGDDGSGSGDGEDGEDPDVVDGEGMATVDTGGGTGPSGGKAVADAEEMILPELTKPEGPPPPDPSTLAALTEHQRQMLDDLLDSMKRQPEVRDIAEQVEDRLNALAEAQASAGKAIERMHTAARHTPDDDRNKTGDDPASYESVAKRMASKASTLARTLAGVLRENSFDRWSVNGYKTGKRLHSRKLHLAAQGNLSVYRRKERPKNRKYAVELLMDVSGSMMGHRITMARDATILVGEALEKAKIDFAVYCFGDDTVCVKPFDRSLADRRGKLGTMHHLTQHFGNSTCMGWAIKRASEEMLARYDNDWQKMIIVVTDGAPNSCGRAGHHEHANPKPLVRELEEDYGVEVIGIGIAENGVRAIFPSHMVLTDVDQLPRMLVQTVRSRVRKG